MENTHINNDAVLRGIVQGEPVLSHTLYCEAFYSLHVSVQRLSGYVDVLPVTVCERLLIQGALNGQCVSIRGQLRSYNKIIDGVNRLVLTVFAHELALSDQDPFNEIFLQGYICKEPIYRTTPFNREITDLLLAVNRAYNKSDYIPCIAWGKNAQITKTLDVGSSIAIHGRIQSREYQKALPDGSVQVRTAYEVSANSLDV